MKSPLQRAFSLHVSRIAIDTRTNQADDAAVSAPSALPLPHRSAAQRARACGQAGLYCGR